MIATVALELVDAGPNDRKTFSESELSELAESIRAHGLAQPPTVRPVGERFEIVAGERRTRACRLLGWETMPAFVRELSDSQAAAIMLAENTSRVDLAPLEEAEAYSARLEVFGSVSEVARAGGVNVDRVRRRLALLSLGVETRHWLATGQLPVTYAERMGGLDVNRQKLALLAYQAGATAEAFASLCRRLNAEQASESMFDVGSFLRVEEYVSTAQEAVRKDENVSDNDPVGIAEIATMLGVKRNLVDQWQHRGLLPAPKWTVGGRPAWERSAVVAWAKSAGKLANGS